MDSTDLFILMLLLNEINKINKISYSEFNEIAYGCYTNSGCLPKRLDSSKLSKRLILNHRGLMSVKPCTIIML